MIDLHTHTFFSDGELVPSELVRRAEVIGYSAIAITDHADLSNLEFVVSRISEVAEELNKAQSVKVIPGIELTHTPPRTIERLTARSRDLGAKIVVVHGETLVEPVKEGTNRAGIDAGVDIIAHPGLITEEDVSLAAKNNVYLEITTRRGHSLSNGYVAGLAVKTGAKLIINTDSHSPDNLVKKEFAEKVLRGSGLLEAQIKSVFRNSEAILDKIFC